MKSKVRIGSALVGILIALVLILVLGCSDSDPDPVAGPITIEDYVGLWSGPTSVTVNNGHPVDYPLKLTINSDGTGMYIYDGDRLYSNSFKVVDEVLHFDVPRSTPDHPDCQEWDLAATLSLDGTYQASGNVCGPIGNPSQVKISGLLVWTAPGDVTTLLAPVLISPDDGDTVTQPPTLSCIQVSGAAKYLFLAWKNGTNYEDLWYKWDPGITSYTHNHTEIGVTYDWMVKAFVGNVDIQGGVPLDPDDFVISDKESDWSEIRSFTAQ